jgi:hypothetical protein
VNKNSYLIQLAEGAYTDFGRISFEQQPLTQKVFSAIWALAARGFSLR